MASGAAAREVWDTYRTENWVVRECSWLSACIRLVSAGSVTQLLTVSTSCGWIELSVAPAAVWPNSAAGSRTQRCVVSKLTSALCSRYMFRPVITPPSGETSARYAKASTIKMTVPLTVTIRTVWFQYNSRIAILPRVVVLFFTQGRSLCYFNITFLHTCYINLAWRWPYCGPKHVAVSGTLYNVTYNKWCV